MGRKSILKRLIQLALGLIRSRGIARYSCKFSKKTFTQHQWLVLGVLKTYLKMDYRTFADWILFSNDLFYILRLKRRPHFTTLQKFLQRFDPSIFDQLIIAVFSQINATQKPLDVAVDGSGFTSSYCSRYFVMRINRETSYKSFMKMSIAVNPWSRALLAVKCRKGPAHDNKDFVPLLRRIDCRLRNVIADKGYDCEANHRFIRNELDAEPVIPVKKNVAGCHKNKLRKRMKRLFLSNPYYKQVYGQRNIAETVFSVIKRRFGGDLRSRLTELKKKEMKLKALTYNLMILTTDKSLFVVVGFLQSHLPEAFK